MQESIEQEIIEYGKSLPAGFNKLRGNLLGMEFIVAERKAFLSRQQLTYRCSLKIDSSQKVVRFFEVLKEKGSGFPSGGDDFSPGFGFKVEKTSTSGAERSGSIKELSILFGKKYSYDFNYQQIREKIESIAQSHGYQLETVLSERHLR